jgi:hypothetical protein
MRSTPEGTSALPGPVTLWPWQREIANAISDPEIERVTIGQGRPAWLHDPIDGRDWIVCCQ